jgi:hypothetical protein
MNFINLWRKVFGKRTSDSGNSSGLDKKIEAPDTAPNFMHANSRREIVRDSSGEITGFWFANPEHAPTRIISGWQPLLRKMWIAMLPSHSKTTESSQTSMTIEVDAL